jgi:D-alanyl-D-alanine dipeptidase
VVKEIQVKVRLLLPFVVFSVYAQGQNNYGLRATSLAEYGASIKSNPEKELVELKNVIPGIVLDIRYATKNNFTGAEVYRLAKAYARKPVAEALEKAQTDFHQLGYGIKIYDAYRPYSATIRFFELMKGDTTYVASPYKGSKHNRGCALDITLIDLKTKEELKMPTAYDSPVKESWPSAPVDDPVIRKNRETLISVMEQNGFRVYAAEWWHFDFIGWEKFEVLDIDFEELEKK